MNETFIAFTALISVVAMFTIAVISAVTNGIECCNLKADMESVGIERFVRCNNSQSNWVEIVWKEKK